MNDLYQEELMDVYKNPHNRGTISDPSVCVSQKNPMCGDEITLRLKIENGVIKEAKFDGSACFVSIVSSSVLTDNLINKNLEEVKKLNKDDLLKLIGLNLSTSRISCATLVLNSLKEAIKTYEEKRN